MLRSFKYIRFRRRRAAFPVLYVCLACLTAIVCGGEPAPTAPRLAEAAAGETGRAEGRLRMVEPLGDPAFVQAGPYLQLRRSVEMHAWKPVEPAGPATDATECALQWTRQPKLTPAEAEICTGKRNRSSYVPDRLYRAELILETETGDVELPAGWTLTGMDSATVEESQIASNQRLRFREGYYYLARECLENPGHNCERLRLEAWPLDAEAAYVVTGPADGEGGFQTFSDSDEENQETQAAIEYTIAPATP